MSSHYQLLSPQLLERRTIPDLERMVGFIDRFTARIVEKLQIWEKDRASSLSVEETNL